MNRTATTIAALGVLLLGVNGAAADHFGSHGPKGNDTGGIIPWSPDSERHAFEIAQENCGRFNKFAVLRSVRRVYGDFIVYDCRWERAQHVHVVRPHRRAPAVIDK
jgi:hypothetical protein